MSTANPTLPWSPWRRLVDIIAISLIITLVWLLANHSPRTAGPPTTRAAEFAEREKSYCAFDALMHRTAPEDPRRDDILYLWAYHATALMALAADIPEAERTPDARAWAHGTQRCPK
jgi:hypothetical protein